MVKKIYEVRQFGIISVVELSDEFIEENNKLNPEAQIEILKIISP